MGGLELLLDELHIVVEVEADGDPDDLPRFRVAQDIR